MRQDLCIRHRERHTTRGSQLQKRDHFAQAAPHIHNLPLVPSNASADSHFPQPGPLSSNLAPMSNPESVSSPSVSEASQPIPLTSSPSVPLGAYHYPSLAQQNGMDLDYAFGTSNHAVASPAAQSNATYSPGLQGSYAPLSGRSSPQTSISSGEKQEAHSYPVSTSAGSEAIAAPYPINTDMNGSSLATPTTYESQPGITIPVTRYPDLSLGTTATPVTTTMGGLDASVMAPAPALSDAGFGGMSPYPIFGGETYNRSPFAMADDFAAWLFNNDPTRGSSSPSPSSLGYPQTAAGMMPNYMDPSQMPDPFFLGEQQQQQAFNGFFDNVLPQHPMSVTSILEPSSPQAILSQEKRQDLLHLMSSRFNESAYSAETKRKDSLMTGDLDDDHHVLSLRMMRTYVGSFWYHFHAQLPILHQPTFVADQAPNLLLLAVMAIGASTLDRIHGQEITDASSELANFIAWHLRWELFMDVDFRPPAKLWIFQALLLLEVYEKRYSTRALHERAHIHHDTTLTLMRRGSSLIGRDSTIGRPAGHTRSGSTTDVASEESWSNWIKAEGTRRVAFAAFMLDSTHATMFGHSVKMVAHELRLPLPCDETLWSANSAAEVARMQSTQRANGVKSITFLDALKKTLNGEAVRTNAFGRSIVMSGLLSVSWHMNQRDLQVSSLGVPQALGGRDKWRSSLLRAFDNWRRDYDEAQGQAQGQGPLSSYRYGGEPALEGQEVLHGLAHMASHVDIVDCQIFAGAGRLLGRSITPRDYNTAREKMTERWATKASARDATFYALKVLSKSLLEHDCFGSEYSARDDNSLNRPWVLYMAALVVWSYGYALDGPLKTSTPLATKAEQYNDMQTFLRRVGGAKDPNELGMMTQRNQCLGVLMILRDSFMESRWELLEEAAGLLGSCIEKLRK